MLTETYFRNGDRYDAINRELTEDKSFYCKAAAQTRSGVLEIGCGTGRITLPIAAKGIEIIGVDPAPGMLQSARKKAVDQGLQVTFLEGDGASIQLDRTFDLVICPFHVLHNFSELTAIESLLQNIRRHLSPDGRLLFDIHNPMLRLLSKNSDEFRDSGHFYDSVAQRMVHVQTHTRYDAAKQILRVTWRYLDEQGSILNVESTDIRCFFPREIDAILHYNGFKIRQKLGTFTGEPFAEHHSKQILDCNLRGQD